MNSIILGDCIKIMKKIPRNSIDLIYADPPYNLGVEKARVDNRAPAYRRPYYSLSTEDWDNQSFSDFKSFTKHWLKECRRILTPKGTIWVSCAGESLFIFGYVMRNMQFKIIQDLVWHKEKNAPCLSKHRPTINHENIIMAKKKKRKSHIRFNYYSARELGVTSDMKQLIGKVPLGSVWRLGSQKTSERLRDEKGVRIHPCQKPEALLRIIIASGSRPGDIVLDPFSGTGTTACVAKKLHRRFICIEKNERYHQVSLDRLSKIVPQPLSDAEASLYDIDKSKYDEKYSGLFAFAKEKNAD